jgi:hypothetical protein
MNVFQPLKATVIFAVPFAKAILVELSLIFQSALSLLF